MKTELTECCSNIKLFNDILADAIKLYMILIFVSISYPIKFNANKIKNITANKILDNKIRILTNNRHNNILLYYYMQ